MTGRRSRSIDEGQSAADVADQLAGDEPDVERVRAELRTLLVRGASLKMQRWGTGDALQTFERARALCERMRVPQPWPALVAYRLAHLILRDAPTPERLLDADELFAQAARCAALGPWPAIYRLAVLHRLGVSRERLERAFRAASDAYGAYSPVDADAAPHLHAPLQSGAFGMLDLAGMFLGMDRTPLEGRGHAAHADALRRGTWVVLAGPLESGGDDVLMPESFARTELHARLAANPALAGVVLSEDGRATWRSPHAESLEPREPLDESYARLLLLLLRGRSQRATIVSALHERARESDVGASAGASNPDVAFRQTCSRLAKRLDAAGLGPLRGQEFIAEHRAGRVRLRPDLPIVGACPLAVLTRERQR